MAALRLAIGFALLVVAGCQRRGDGAEIAVVGEATRLRWDETLPRATPWFDGKVVRLRAARGEVVGIQVVREGAGEVEIGIEGLEARGFEVDFHDVRAPSTAMYGGSRGVGRYPDRLRPAEGAVRAAREGYFEIAAERSGTGTLRVGEKVFPVELVVEDVELPVMPVRVWAYYDPRELTVRAGERAWVEMFRAYGVMASPELTAESWEARRWQVEGAPFIPVLLPREPEEAIAAEVEGWIERTRGSGQVPFAIPIDEPRTILAQLKVRARAAVVRAAGGGKGRFLYAVTQKRSWLLGGDVDVFVSPFGGDWTYNGTPPWAGAMVLDAAEPGTRTWGWIGFRHDLPLWYVWDVAYWRDRYNRGRDRAPRHDLVSDPITFDDGEDRGNLDGVLGYVEEGSGRPLPSLRLAALRRGLQDRMLLELLAACGGKAAAEAIAGELVPRSLGGARRGERASWPSGGGADGRFEAARLRVLDELVACRRAADR